MNKLAQQTCEACRADAPKVSDSELAELIKEIPDWQTVVVDNVTQLQRIFTFANFVEAIDFTIKVGEYAEDQGHHPALLTEWGKVTVSWWTHKINGLHRNDFICAAMTDQIELNRRK